MTPHFSLAIFSLWTDGTVPTHIGEGRSSFRSLLNQTLISSGNTLTGILKRFYQPSGHHFSSSPLNLTITCSELILTTLIQCRVQWSPAQALQTLLVLLKGDEARRVCVVWKYNSWNKVSTSFYFILFLSTHGDIIWSAHIWRTIMPYQEAVSGFAWVLTWMKKLFSFPPVTFRENLLAS